MDVLFSSSDLKDGQVQYVSILSEKGRPCTLENPWPGNDIRLVSDNIDTKTLTGSQITFDTRPGRRYVLTQQ